MSASGDKIRPRVERIARLAGSTTFKDFREGFGGAAPVLTDQEVSLALAVSRRRYTDAECDVSSIGPEVLETFYGSTQQHRRALVKAYLAAVDGGGAVRQPEPAKRMAATLAAQQVAGLTLSFKQHAEYAFISAIRVETMRSMIADAHQWFMDRHDEALPTFVATLKAVVEKRLDAFLAKRAEDRRAAVDRANARAAAKNIAKLAEAS